MNKTIAKRVILFCLGFFLLGLLNTAYAQKLTNVGPTYTKTESENPSGVFEERKERYLQEGFTVEKEGIYGASYYAPFGGEVAPECGRYIRFIKITPSDQITCDPRFFPTREEHREISIGCVPEYYYPPGSWIARKREKPSYVTESFYLVDRCGQDEGEQTPKEEICQYSPKEEARRQEILVRLREKYRFSVLDSNLCGQEACGNNSPWSEAELLEIEATFEQLPTCFTDRLALSQIRGRQGGETLFSSVWERECCETKNGQVLKTQSGIFGGYLSFEGKITICDRWFKEKGKTLEELLTHEMTHAFQQDGAMTVPRLPSGPYTNPIVISWLKETGWSPDGICLPVIGCPGTTIGVPPDLPSDYARETKNPLEDMTESVRLYVTNPEELLSISPRRYNFVRDNIFCGKEYR